MQHIEIRLEGRLDQTWADWLDGFALTYHKDCETILTGEIRDQAALYGLMAKLRDLGATLISVRFGPAE
jgi:hypothetical protein